MSAAPLAQVPRIGLTGGIGSGKSSVARMLADLGAAVVDADAVAHSVTQAHGTAIAAVMAHFGPDYATPEGGLNRDAMRQLVFADASQRQVLEALLRPYILQAIADASAAALARTDITALVLDIPLLVENLAQWRPQLDAIVVVDCSKQTQVDRVLQRPSSSHWTVAQVEGVLAAQATRAQRLAAADWVLNNEAGTSWQQLREQAHAAWQQIQSQYGHSSQQP